MMQKSSVSIHVSMGSNGHFVSAAHSYEEGVSKQESNPPREQSSNPSQEKSYFYGGSGKTISANMPHEADRAISGTSSTAPAAKAPRFSFDKIAGKLRLAVILAATVVVVGAIASLVTWQIGRSASHPNTYSQPLAIGVVIFIVVAVFSSLAFIVLKHLKEQRAQKEKQQAKERERLYKAPLDTYEDQYVEDLAKKYEG